MKILFRIPNFELINDKFIINDYNEYTITYLKGIKIHQLRVVVNGYLTNQVINIVDGNSGYKNILLTAIKEYIDFGHLTKNRVTKNLKLTYVEQFYSKKIVHNLKTFLLPINKEVSRDTLTKFGLIQTKKYDSESTK